MTSEPADDTVSDTRERSCLLQLLHVADVMQSMATEYGKIASSSVSANAYREKTIECAELQAELRTLESKVTKHENTILALEEHLRSAHEQRDILDRSLDAADAFLDLTRQERDDSYTVMGTWLDPLLDIVSLYSGLLDINHSSSQPDPAFELAGSFQEWYSCSCSGLLSSLAQVHHLPNTETFQKQQLLSHKSQLEHRISALQSELHTTQKAAEALSARVARAAAEGERWRMQHKDLEERLIKQESAIRRSRMREQALESENET
jgi:septal ring factor EnvC (AmiA/AmiB activator)